MNMKTSLRQFPIATAIKKVQLDLMEMLNISKCISTIEKKSFQVDKLQLQWSCSLVWFSLHNFYFYEVAI
ncbi:hypothetical protein L1987_20898 [Smallanthus sonchifolius]|uniref:Uncharacterized protein n=1 Tax=Smallanthus sonchifolius TaxID=185202 RepID=A0ACB9IUK3_9ASTR|nr:hypothetical protein L1987_20898 [Smallanthus sonchifolius]